MQINTVEFQPEIMGKTTEQIINSIHESSNHILLQNEFKYTLRIDANPPVYFSNYDIHKRKSSSARWISMKHRDGTLHEPGTINALRYIQANFLSRINVVFDIGALFGYFSLISKSMFPNATVYGFEMNPVSYQTFSENANLNYHLGSSPIQCINAGISDRTIMHENVDIDGFILREEAQAETQHKINLLKLDDFCQISGYQPDLIKIDVEGYQAKIFPGAIKTIEQSKPIILLEFDNHIRLKPFETTNKEIIKPLFDLGYQLYWCKDQRNPKGEFIKLNYDDLTVEHEDNSLGMFIPN